MLTKSVKDVIVGSRKTKVNSKEFIALCLAETKAEIKESNLNTKYNAVCKLLYFYLERIDIKWASFYLLELMSSTKFRHKRLAYLVASYALPSSPEFIILTTNLFKKDFKAPNYFELGNALNCASLICTRELSNTIENDPFVRKRACILCKKLLLTNPQSDQHVVKQMINKLQDANTGVSIAACSTILECSTRNPSMFLHAIPILYKLLDSKNNWLVIKALQSLLRMIEIEKRLLTRLPDKIAQLLNNSTALSVEYELCKSVVLYFTEYGSLMQIAKNKISNYLQNNDQNIRYIGLMLLKQLLLWNSDLLIIYKDQIMRNFTLSDLSLKSRTLEIIQAACSQDTFEEIINEIIPQISNVSPQFKGEIIETILIMISQNHYENIKDFKWLLNMLKDLILQSPSECEIQLANLFQDIGIRIEDVRDLACELGAFLLSEHFQNMLFLNPKADISSDIELSLSTNETFSQETHIFGMEKYNGYLIANIVYILGEFSQSSKIKHNLNIIIEGMKRTEFHQLKEGAIISGINSAFKLISKYLNLENTGDDSVELLNRAINLFETFLNKKNDFIEMGELITFYSGILRDLSDEQNAKMKYQILAECFEEELLPVHEKSQSAVRVSEDLDIYQKLKIDSKELEVLRENKIVKILIEVEKGKIQPKKPAQIPKKKEQDENQKEDKGQEEEKLEKGDVKEIPGELEKPKGLTINKEYFLPPGVTIDDLNAEPEINIQLANQNTGSMKQKKKMKRKKIKS